MKTTIGVACKRVRVSRGLTIREFADQVGEKIEIIKEYEKDIREIPKEILIKYLELK